MERTWDLRVWDLEPNKFNKIKDKVERKFLTKENTMASTHQANGISKDHLCGISIAKYKYRT